MMKKFSKCRSILSTILLLSAYHTSYAAGFQLNETSPALQGAANAGAAAANNDVSAMFNNPATLSTLTENQVYVGASAIFPRINVTKESAIHTVNIPGTPPSNITAIVLGNHAQNNIAKWAFVPDAYFGWRVNDRLVAGIALTSPFGLSTEYDKHSVLRFAALKSSLISFNVNPAVAYIINPQWSVGAGFQLQYAIATFSNFNGPYTGIPEIDAFIAADFPTKLHARGWGLGYNLGVLYEPCQSTRFGLGYRSGIRQELHGDGKQFTSPGPTVPAPSQGFLFNAKTSVNGAVHLPAVLFLSAAQDLANWTLKASAQLNFWESFKSLSINMPEAFATHSTIPTNWKNTWLLSLGADYCLNQKWTLRAGAAYDQTPTRNRYRDPRIPDSDRYWLTGGFTHRMNKNISIDGAYEHIFSKRQTVNVSQPNGSNAISTLPLEVNTVKAKYKSSVNIFAIAIRYNFC